MNITITKEEFIALYMSMTVKQVAKRLKVKENQVVKLAKQLNISKPRGKQSGNRLVLADTEVEE